MRACDNPFGVHHTERLRYRLDEAGWSALLDRWRAQGGRGALVGPHGSGKTRLQRELGRRLEREGFQVRRLQWGVDRRPSVGDQESALRGLGAGDVLLIDGAEQLTCPAWWRLRYAARGASGLVITSHREGRLPALWRHQTSPALLMDLVHELVGVARAEALAPLCQTLFVQHAGNLRDCLRSLYDVHALHSAG
jgi:hypothetical protein